MVKRFNTRRQADYKDEGNSDIRESHLAPGEEYLCIIRKMEGPKKIKNGNCYLFIELDAIGQQENVWSASQVAPAIMIAYDHEEASQPKTTWLGEGKWRALCDACQIAEGDISEEDFLGSPLNMKIDEYNGRPTAGRIAPATDKQCQLTGAFLRENPF